MSAVAQGRDDVAYKLFRRVVEKDPKGADAAQAIDLMAELRGDRLLPDLRFDCSAEAEAIADEAEDLRARGLRPEAVAAYRRAHGLCPANATWIFRAADTVYAAGDLEGAERLYEEGLALDPWNRSGHSVLASALEGLGDPEAAFRHHLLAVVSDPTYETGWYHLRQAAEARGGRMRRIFERKPSVGADGTMVMVADRDHPPSQSWTSYAMMALGDHFAAQGQATAAPEASGSPAPPTALDREREKVDAVGGESQESVAAGLADPSPFWRMLSIAVPEGLKDEAIFMGLMDAPLADEYPAFRQKHVEGLLRFLREVAIEFPMSPTAPISDRQDR